MYGSVFASTRAPWRMLCGSIPWVMWITSTSGAIRLITPWQVPAKSSSTPKSDRNVITATATSSRGGTEDSSGQPVQVLRLRFGNHGQACVTRGCGRDRTDRHDRKVAPDGRERPGRGAGCD